MSFYICIALMAVNTVVGLKRPKMGIGFYMFLCLFGVVFSIGGLKISYEIPGLIPLLFSLCAHHSGKNRIRTGWFMFIYFAVTVFSTCVSIFFMGTKFLPASMLGECRYVLLFYILIKYFDYRWIEICFLMLVPLNFVIVLYQYFDSNALIWSYNMFAKTSSGSLSATMEMGHMSRLYGIFDNIFPGSFFLLISIVMGMSRFCQAKGGRKAAYMGIVIMAVISGFFMASKTFMVGLPLALMLWITLSDMTRNPMYKLVKAKNAAIIACILVACAALFLNIEKFSNSGSLLYYLNSITSGNMMNSRYGSNGVLAETIEVVRKHWLIGIGVTTLKSEFLGDSGYVCILHEAGVVGLSIFLLFWWEMFWKFKRRRDVPGAVMAVMILALSVGGSTLFNMNGIAVTAYLYLRLFGKSEEVFSRCRMRFGLSSRQKPLRHGWAYKQVENI